MTQPINRFVRTIGLLSSQAFAAFLLLSVNLSAETLSLNGSGDFNNQFTQKAGSGNNRFEEAASIGVAGSRAIQRSATGSEMIAYTRNTSMGGVLASATVSLRFNYSTNSSGIGGEPLFFGITSNANFDGSNSGNGQDDFIGAELSQRLTGSNESKLTLFNGLNGARTDTADSGFENLTPGWYEIEISITQAGGLFDLAVALHRMNANGSSYSETDVITAAISSLTNADVVNATDLFYYLGGSDTIRRGVEAIDELAYTGFGTPVTISAPSGLVANAVSQSQINLTWNDNSGNETSFKVQRKQGTSSWGEIADLSANTLSYADTGLTNSTAYTYRIVAVNSEASSDPSNEATATTGGDPTPNVPTDMVASAFSMTQVDLTWTDTSDNENWFRIERKVDNGGFANLIDLAPNIESYSDTGLNPNTTYTYRISSANAAGLSSPSNEAVITTPDVPVPSAPTNLRFVSTSVSQISVAWNDASNDEQGFRLERKIGSGAFEQIVELAADNTSYNDTSVQELGDYTYRIYAFNSNGNSAFSNLIQVSLPFLAPTDLASQAVSYAQVNLNWTDNSGVETGFRIERKVGSGAFATLLDVGANVTSHSDVSVNPSTSYTYRVTGLSSGVLSDPSNESVVTTPDSPSIAAPSGLVATALSHTKINLTWNDNSNNEVSFRIQRRQGSGSWGEIAQLSPNTENYIDEGLVASTSYTYRIVAVNNEATSNPSNEETSTTTDEPPPGIPANLVASAYSMTRIDLTWTDTADTENWFRIERKVGDGEFADLIDLAPNSEAHSDEGLSPNTTYTYRVRSANDAGLSPASNEASATTPDVPLPSAPTNLRITSSKVADISVAWNDNSSDEQGFRLERKTGSGDFEQIASLDANATSYSDTATEELGDYSYRVYAYNANGVSGFSNPISVSLPFLAPTALTAQAISSSQINLNWSDNSGVETGFRIERKTADGPFVTIVNVGKDVTSFSDLTVNPVTNYTYRITGISFTVFSNHSNQSAVTTPDIEPPAAPASLIVASQGLDHVVLNWTDSSDDEDGFRVERRTGSGGFEALASTHANVTAYTDNQVTELGNYTYRIRSYNDGGDSSPSNEVSTQIEFDSPTTLVALAISSEQIDLSWSDNSVAETGYRVERKPGEGDFEILATLGANLATYTDTDVQPLSSYTYRVVGLAGVIESDPTNEASASTPNIPAPGSVSELVANLVDASYVALNWSDNSIDELGFRIQRKVADGGWNDYAQLPSNTTSFQDSEVLELGTYAYRVVAFNDGGESTASNETSVFFPFKSPTGLSAKASSSSRIDLAWEDNSTVESSYRVERKSGDGAFETLATVLDGIAAHADETVSADIAYTYRIIGLYTGGESNPSNEATATTTAEVTTPAVPVGLTATALSYNEINLTWTDVSDNESGFRIERKEGAEGPFVFIGNVDANATTFNDNSLKSNTTYSYRISAFVNSAQSSENSAEVSATTSAIPAAEAPSGLEVSSQSLRGVSLTWTDNSDVESGFNIQRKAGSGNFEDLVTVDENITFYTDKTVSEFKTYAYRVRANGLGGNSDFSNEATAVIPLGAPELLVGVAIDSTQVQLDWVDTSSIETGFRIERKTRQGSFETLGTGSADSILYVDESVAANTTYTYRIYAVRNQTQSSPSNLVNVTTPNTSAPEAPTGLEIAKVSDTSASVSWTDNSGNELGFRIFRKNLVEGVWIEIGDVAANVDLFIDNSALSGVNYSYRVTAYNEGGQNVPVESDFRIPVAARLVNISTRGLVETGDNVMIGSFIIQGDGPKTVLVRGIGPSIAPAVDAPILNDPEITLVSGTDLNNPIAYNDDWRDSNEAGIIITGLAPDFDVESALVVQLPPGAYSAILSGVNQGTGFGLVEVYELDNSNNNSMVNISTRSFVQAESKRMIGGFVITGDTPARVYIRATGPSLVSSIENRLMDPVLQLFAGQNELTTNDNWQDSEQIGQIIASGIPPTDERESAIVAILQPGSYTAIVGGKDGTSGYCLLEIYDFPE